MPLYPATAADLPAIVDLVNAAYRGETSRQGWTTEADYLEGQRTDLATLTRDLAETPGAALFMWRDDPATPLLGSVWLEPAETEPGIAGILTAIGERFVKVLPRSLVRELGGAVIALPIYCPVRGRRPSRNTSP